MKRIVKYLTMSTILLLLIVVHNLFDPPDWVTLYAEGVPPDVDPVYVVVRNGESIVPLNWYRSMIEPVLIDSKGGPMWDTRPGERRQKGEVQWISGDAYGILARRKSGEWVLWWVDPSDIIGPSSMRYIFGGGGEVWMLVANGAETAPPAPKFVTEQIWSP